MSHSRRTRKQKEAAAKRRVLTVEKAEISMPVYSINSVNLNGNKKKKITNSELPKIKTNYNIEEKTHQKEKSTYAMQDVTYLKQDIRNISAAAGLVIAFDVIFYVLLFKGLIRLPFFGY